MLGCHSRNLAALPFAMTMTVLLSACEKEQVNRGSSSDARASARVIGKNMPNKQCASGERAIYTCDLKGKVLSVCVGANRAVYRFGASHNPEIEIESNGLDGKISKDVIVGGGTGGQEQQIIFQSGPYSYVVYSAVGGEWTDKPGDTWSGVAILHNGKLLRNLTCQSKTTNQEFDVSSLDFVDDQSNSSDFGWF
jgi:hypothetical protein